ncbi:hypothetical protein FB446DRAFT_454788 [Lentinula raphanica]|nr:hypothetical protein FB446DRAFT_454788 [Lentinula raphanica]
MGLTLRPGNDTPEPLCVVAARVVPGALLSIVLPIPLKGSRFFPVLSSGSGYVLFLSPFFSVFFFFIFRALIGIMLSWVKIGGNDLRFFFPLLVIHCRVTQGTEMDVSVMTVL